MKEYLVKLLVSATARPTLKVSLAASVKMGSSTFPPATVKDVSHVIATPMVNHA